VLLLANLADYSLAVSGCIPDTALP
jgi:hypothetical protein